MNYIVTHQFEFQDNCREDWENHPSQYHKPIIPSSIPYNPESRHQSRDDEDSCQNKCGCRNNEYGFAARMLSGSRGHRVRDQLAR